jgi:hypothetical protein
LAGSSPSYSTVPINSTNIAKRESPLLFPCRHTLYIKTDGTDNLSFVGSIILHIAYGYPTLVDDDPFIADGADVLKAFRIAGLPGSFLVDIFPILKYVPSRFPGAGFKRWAAHYRSKETSARRECFRYAVDAMVSHIPINILFKLTYLVTDVVCRTEEAKQ